MSEEKKANENSGSSPKSEFPLNTALIVLTCILFLSSLLVNILGFSDTYYNLSRGLLIGTGLLVVVVLSINFRTVLAFFKKKQTLYSLNSVLMAVLLLVALGFVNYLGQKNPIELDLTEEKINRLSEQSTKVLEKLDKKILLTVVLKKEHQPAAKDLFVKYRKISPDFFEFRFLDEKTDPIAVKTFVKNKSKTAVYGMASLTINPSDPESMREIFIDEASEETITNGIIRLTQNSKPVIYFVEGHGEKAIDSTGPGGIDMVVEALNTSGNTVKGLKLSGITEVPSDADLVVIAGPRTGFLPAETALLRNFLKSGGKGIFLLDPDLEGSPSRVLNTLLSEFGVDATGAVVLDPRAVVPGNENWAAPLITSYAPLHPVTKDLQAQSYFPVAQVVQKGQVPTGLQVDWLFQSTSGGWGESDIAGLRSHVGDRPKYDDGKDIKGPVKLAVAVRGVFPEENPKKGTPEKNDPNKEMKMVVVGNGSFIGNGFANLINHDLFLNMVNWSTGQEDLISIRPKKERQVSFEVSDNSLYSISLLSWAVIPLFFLSASVLVYFRRRRL